jgi:hypothetical protein
MGMRYKQDLWSVDVTLATLSYTLAQTLAMTLDQTYYCPHSVHTVNKATNELVTIS